MGAMGLPLESLAAAQTCDQFKVCTQTRPGEGLPGSVKEPHHGDRGDAGGEGGPALVTNTKTAQQRGCFPES